MKVNNGIESHFKKSFSTRTQNFHCPKCCPNFGIPQENLSPQVIRILSGTIFGFGTSNFIHIFLICVYLNDLYHSFRTFTAVFCCILYICIFKYVSFFQKLYCSVLLHFSICVLQLSFSLIFWGAHFIIINLVSLLFPLSSTYPSLLSLNSWPFCHYCICEIHWSLLVEVMDFIFTQNSVV